MRKLSLLAALVAVCLLASGLRAQDKKEVTLKGTILCAKCALKEAKKCQTAIQVKEKGNHVPLSELKLLKSDPAAVQEQSEAIKARYTKLFGV